MLGPDLLGLSVAVHVYETAGRCFSAVCSGLYCSIGALNVNFSIFLCLTISYILNLRNTKIILGSVKNSQEKKVTFQREARSEDPPPLESLIYAILLN